MDTGPTPSYGGGTVHSRCQSRHGGVNQWADRYDDERLTADSGRCYSAGQTGVPLHSDALVSFASESPGEDGVSTILPGSFAG